MTHLSTPRINPNILLERPRPSLKDDFHAIKVPEVDVQPPISQSKRAPHRRKRKPVFERLANMHFVGKAELILFLYQKQRRQCKHSTLSNYCVNICSLLRFVTKLGKTRLDQLGTEDLEAFIEHEQDRGLMPATLHQRLISFYCFADYLVNQDIVPPHRFERKIRIKVPDALPKAMDPVDVKRLLAVIDDVRDRAMIVVMLRTGLRIGELLALKVDDVRLAEKKILIWEGEKNCVGRTVCLSDDACKDLGQWRYYRDPQKAQLFYGKHRNSLGYTASSLMLQKYLNKAGLAGKGYTLHSLRHTFATDLLNAGMRIECLQQLLGHGSLQMTLRYARLTDRTREQEYFTAMAIIEGEMNDGSDPFDSPLSPASQT